MLRPHPGHQRLDLVAPAGQVGDGVDPAGGAAHAVGRLDHADQLPPLHLRPRGALGDLHVDARMGTIARNLFFAIGAMNATMITAVIAAIRLG